MTHDNATGLPTFRVLGRRREMGYAFVVFPLSHLSPFLAATLCPSTRATGYSRRARYDGDVVDSVHVPAPTPTPTPNESHRHPPCSQQSLSSHSIFKATWTEKGRLWFACCFPHHFSSLNDRHAVVITMSGGVDSSVAALTLAQEVPVPPHARAQR